MFWKRGNTNRIGRQRRASNAMVEGLEHRLLLASIITGTDSIGKVITFTGGDAAETVTISDNGSGRVTVSGAGLTSGAQTGVDHVVVNANGGNDTVNYNLTNSTLTGTSRQFQLDVDLGSGLDDFTANIAIAINNKHTLNVQGGDDPDSLTVVADRTFNPNGIRIASQTSLNLNLKGGGSGDVINVSYQGDMDGTLAISALLDQFLDLGDDTADIVVVLDSGSGSVSSGGHKLTLTVEGGFVNDTITALVGDHSDGNVSVSASVDAGTSLGLPESDTVTRTANVSVTNAETIHTVSAPAFVDRTITAPVALGQPTKVSGIITEPDAGDTFFLHVNWGDGNSETFEFPAGSFVSGVTRVTVEHVYSHVGKYQISLTWRDQTGLSNDDNTLVAKVLPATPSHRSKRDRDEDDADLLSVP